MKIHLFTSGNFKLHSSKRSKWKIKCDALTEEDYETLAWIVAKEWKLDFGSVISVPSGGNEFANKLKQYKTREAFSTILIVDDVLTTGQSMKKFYDLYPMKVKIGVVIFARGKCPKWIRPLFQYYIDEEE